MASSPRIPTPNGSPSGSSSAESLPRWPFVVIAAALGLRAAMAAGTDLYFDEAYYWHWAQRPALSYFDHPPLIAWLIRVLGVRPGAFLLGAATLWAVYLLAKDAAGSRAAGLRAAALCSALPAAHLAGVIATPDTPLLLFWALGLWALGQERWGWAGFAVGAAMLSKYTGALLPLAFLIYSALRQRLPKGVWASGALALALFSPVLLWNARNDWASFLFQLRHGLAGAGTLSNLVEFAGGQWAMAGPLLLPGALIWLIGEKKASGLWKAAFAVPLLVFAWASLRARGEANWAAPAYLAACAALAQREDRWPKAIAWSGLFLCAAGTAYLVWPSAFAARHSAYRRLHGNAALSALAHKGASAVYSNGYGMASLAGYYAKLPAQVAASPRPTQFEFWPAPQGAPGSDALWVTLGASPPGALTSQYREVVGPEELLGEYGGVPLHRFKVWTLRGLLPNSGTDSAGPRPRGAR